jgi:putative membrane protein
VTARELLVHGWTWRASVVVPVGAAVVLYGVAARPRSAMRTLAMLGSAAFVLLALVSPIDRLARGVLFSAHMLQHMLLVVVAPPLALLAMPRACLGGRPASPVATWLLGVGAMWLWHVPALCNRAATSGTMRAIQTVSLLVMGAAFWSPVLGPRLDRRLPDLAAVAYLFTACLACTLLGATLALSPVEVCTAYLHSVVQQPGRDALGVSSLVRDQWGLTPPVDQQLGGLLMWVPGCAIYATAILAILRRFYLAPREPARGGP